jgi:alpha-beta hydrolase superfamily lysophospholipase
MFCKSAEIFAKVTNKYVKTFSSSSSLSIPTKTVTNSIIDLTPYRACAVVTSSNTVVKHVDLKTITKSHEFFKRSRFQAHILSKLYPHFFHWKFHQLNITHENSNNNNNNNNFVSDSFNSWEKVYSIPVECND